MNENCKYIKSSARTCCLLAIAAFGSNTMTARDKAGELVASFEEASGTQRVEIANQVFRLLDEEEITDSLIQFPTTVDRDSLAAYLYYWVGEQKFLKEEYAAGPEYFEKAAKAIAGSNPGLLNDCYNDMAICYARRGLFSLALEAAARCIEIGEQMGDKWRLVTATNIIGSTYIMAKRPEEGEKYLLRSLALAQELNDSVYMAVRYGTLSELYHTLGNDMKSEEFAREALRLDSLRGDRKRMAVRRVQIASPLFAMERTDEAGRLLRQALPVLEEAHNMVSLPICLNQLGYVYLRSQEWGEAAACFERVIDIYSKTGERFGAYKAHWGLWQALQHTDMRQAASHLETYAVLKDSIYQRDMAQVMADYDARYQNDELRRQNEQERQHSRMVKWIAGGIIVLLTGGVIVLLYILHLKTRNTHLEKQLDRVREHMLTPADKDFIQHVDELLEKQFLGYTVNFERLASDLCITRTGLNRKIKTLLGQTMSEHMNQLRLERAKRLIEQGELNITEVSHACGIEDVAYFSRFFRKMAGVSPSEYKASLSGGSEL